VIFESRIADCGLPIKKGEPMNPEEFKARTKKYAVRVIRLVDALPASRSTNALANQLVRSGTSVGANYRSACRAKSRADFISKMGTVEEEADEALYGMELLIESGKMKPERLSDLMKESDEILAMVCASAKTARFSNQSAIRNRQSAIPA
jgi:four helix bundle protein